MEENVLKKMAEQPPLTADLLVRKIYARLEENIISMNLPPGSKLVEDNIAQVLGVSRSPVREALLQLENAGLVVRQAGKGRVVAGFSEQEIVDNYQVWEMIESYAGGIACLTADESDFSKVEEIIKQMLNLSNEDGYLPEYRRLNYSFHYCMVAPCRNKMLIRMYETALKPIRLCWNLSILWKHDLSRSYGEHRQILEAYRGRDRAAFEHLARNHIKKAGERMWTEYVRRTKSGEVSASPELK
ncbi:MAG: GntR family transcriptional regulator [Deltaproteobacteria bacterium]|nr:GntR family transcriptional regulator [Deltaproteobacteria bacterium]